MHGWSKEPAPLFGKDGLACNGIRHSIRPGRGCTPGAMCYRDDRGRTGRWRHHPHGAGGGTCQLPTHRQHGCRAVGAIRTSQDTASRQVRHREGSGNESCDAGGFDDSARQPYGRAEADLRRPSDRDQFIARRAMIPGTLRRMKRGSACGSAFSKYPVLPATLRRGAGPARSFEGSADRQVSGIRRRL